MFFYYDVTFGFFKIFKFKVVGVVWDARKAVSIFIGVFLDWKIFLLPRPFLSGFESFLLTLALIVSRASVASLKYIYYISQIDKPAKQD